MKKNNITLPSQIRVPAQYQLPARSTYHILKPLIIISVPIILIIMDWFNERHIVFNGTHNIFICTHENCCKLINHLQVKRHLRSKHSLSFSDDEYNAAMEGVLGEIGSLGRCI